MTVFPTDLSDRFGPQDLPGQYVLSKNTTHLPPGWPRHELAGWHLAAHPRLPVLPLAGENGRAAGFLLGHPITADGVLLRPAADSPAETDQRPFALPLSSFDALEEQLYALSGSWAALLLELPQPRIYLDPAASVNAVFSPTDGMVARSEMLIPFSAATPERRALIAQMGIPELNTHYPNGMTSREGVERVLPGHYLDLTKWVARRHWPVGPPQPVDDPQTAVAEIASLLKVPMRALAAHMPLQFSLTAGRDSRSLLACARDLMDVSTVFTTELPAELTRRDVYWAKRMARDLNLPHEVIPYVAAEQRLLDLWLYRTGLAAGNYLSYLGIGVAQKMRHDAAYLQSRFSGLARDVWSEGIYALHPEWDGRTITPTILLQAGQIPDTEETSERLRDWLEELPVSEAPQVMNIFQMEYTVGARSSVLALANLDTHPVEVWPYNQRRVAELMNGFHGAYWQSRQFYVDILRQEWPELARYPFNEFTRSMIYGGKLRRAWGRLKTR